MFNLTDIILLTTAIIFIAVAFWQLLKTLSGDAPFIFSRRRALNLAADNLILKPGQEVWELGAGSAPLLRRLARRYPQNNFIGYEYLPLPWLLGTLLCLPYRNIKIKRKNFFQIDLAPAAYLYCFLNIKTMVKLEEKFLASCRDNAVVISYIFVLPNLQPFKILPVGQEKIYFYRINNLDKTN